jgi:hypothetical protein
MAIGNNAAPLLAELLQYMAFIAPRAGIFHYAIAIALSTSDDMWNSPCAAALP